MRKLILIAILVFVVFVELNLSLLMSGLATTNSLRTPYRRQERNAALRAFSEDKSPENEKALKEEMRLASEYTNRQGFIKFGVALAAFLVFDGLAIWWWRRDWRIGSTPITEIRKEHVVGARIVDIHEAYESLDEGLECRTIYFTVDRGFTFTTPFAGVRWMTANLPANAKRLKNEIVEVKQIQQRVIAGVYCAKLDEKSIIQEPQEGILVFDDGSQVANTAVAQQGAGSARLFYASKGSETYRPVEQLVDYFRTP
jgi:hypothetical protein